MGMDHLTAGTGQARERAPALAAPLTGPQYCEGTRVRTACERDCRVRPPAVVFVLPAPAGSRKPPAAPAARQGAATADLVLLNGNVITVDARDRVAQAVAIAGDKILAVGTNAEIRALIGPATQQVDLKGLTVTPGLLDAHAHFASGGVHRLFTHDLPRPEMKNLADVPARLA